MVLSALITLSISDSTRPLVRQRRHESNRDTGAASSPAVTGWAAGCGLPRARGGGRGTHGEPGRPTQSDLAVDCVDDKRAELAFRCGGGERQGRRGSGITGSGHGRRDGSARASHGGCALFTVREREIRGRKNEENGRKGRRGQGGSVRRLASRRRWRSPDQRGARTGDGGA